MIRDSFTKDEINFGTPNFRDFERDENIDSDYYMEDYARKRRRTLFNLYAFTFTDSFQKDVKTDINRTIEVN